MKRMNALGQGFVDSSSITYDPSGTFTTTDVMSHDSCYLVNVHSGTKLGYVRDGEHYLATTKWARDHDDIGVPLKVYGMTSQGDVFDEGETTGKRLAFTAAIEGEERVLSYVRERDRYEFVRGEHKGLLAIDMFSPSARQFVYGDVFVLENESGYFSKGEVDGCVTGYPVYKNHPHAAFSSETTSGFTHNYGPMFCKSAECDDLSDSPRYGKYAGCNMMAWQLIPASRFHAASVAVTKAASTVVNNKKYVLIASIVTVLILIVLIKYALVRTAS